MAIVAYLVQIEIILIVHGCSIDIHLLGELLIRHSLEHAFSVLGVELHVMSSDAAFLKAKGDQYDIIIVDPW